MIPREPPAVCLGCGHTRPWHSTGNGCTHEVRDKNAQHLETMRL